MSLPQLGPYRVSRTLSAKLRLVTLLAVTAVVFVHANNMTSRFVSGENAAEMRGAPGVVGFVEYLISQALTRWPAAMLFAISGFLFFHNLQPLWADYRRKYAGRVRTVLVPFLLWSAISLVVYLVLQALPWSSTYFSHDFFGEVSVARLADKLLLHPVAYPLWFLQTLIVCFVVAPLLYWPARVLRWVAVLPFAGALGARRAGVRLERLEGAHVLHARRRDRAGAAAGRRAHPAALGGQAGLPRVGVACLLYTALLRDVSAFWATACTRLSCAWLWLPCGSGTRPTCKPLEGRRLVTFLLPFSFFIFAAQEPLLTILKRVGLHVLGSSNAAMLAVYFGAALVTLVIVVAAGAVIRRYLPAPYAWLTGGRGGRGKRRAPTIEPAAEATDVTGEPALVETSPGSPGA